jgi:hypothetical protein
VIHPTLPSANAGLQGRRRGQQGKSVDSGLLPL